MTPASRLARLKPSVADLRLAVIARAAQPFHGYGGLERHVFDLVRHLLAADVSVTLITRTPVPVAHGFPPSRADALAHPRLNVHHVTYPTFPFAGRRGTTILDRSTAYPLFGLRAGRVAAELARRGAVDAVYGLGASALGYARARRRDPRGTRPFVFNPQGLEEFGATDPERAGLKRWAYLPLRLAVRSCAAAADRVIATDRSLEPVVRRHLGVPSGRVRIVPNGVDLDACDRLAGPADGRAVRARHGIADDEFLLLGAGRLEENKGFQTLVTALARVDADAARPKAAWRCVLVGDGPYRARLRRAVAAEGLDSRVTFAGRVGDGELHAWYEAASLFVHPTLYEGSSLVTLEAMAHRRAIVATSAGGLPDKVRPGVNGWLVPPGDAGALAVALVEAWRAHERLRAMGDAGRAIAKREFAWPIVARRLLDVVGELVPRA